MTGDHFKEHNWDTSKSKQGNRKIPQRSLLLDCSLGITIGVQYHWDLRSKQSVPQIIYKEPPRKSTYNLLLRTFLGELASNVSYFQAGHVCRPRCLSLLPTSEHCNALRSRSHTQHVWARHCEHYLSEILQETIHRIRWSWGDAGRPQEGLIHPFDSWSFSRESRCLKSLSVGFERQAVLSRDL